MRIEKLARTHDRAGFDCGEESLNRFLREYVRQNTRENLGVTYVAVPESGSSAILGYYTLAMAEIDRELLPDASRPPLRSVPAALLARLATDLRYRGTGLGKLLVSDCLQRVANLSDEIGVHVVVLDALNDPARDFYTRHFGFETLRDDPHHLYLPVRFIRKALAR